MYRADAENFDPDANGVGKAGYSDGDPITPRGATVIAMDHLNAIQEEIAGVVEGSGQSLLKANKYQMKQELRPLTMFQRLMASKWIAGTAPLDAVPTWSSVCYAPALRRWVAVADAGTNRVMYSDDGKNWIAASASEANSWNSVCWSEAIGLFVACASTGTNRVMTSPDGITWTARAVPGTPASWRVVIWVPELSLYVGLGGTSNMYSANGTSWTVAVHGVNQQWTAMAYAPALGKFVATCTDTAAVATLTSTNGQAWSAGSSLQSNGGGFNYGIAWSPELGRYVVCGADTLAVPKMQWSDDGTTWALVTPALPSTMTTDTPRAIVWAPELSMFLAAGSANWASKDGKVWEAQTGNLISAWSIAWAADRCCFVIVQRASSLIAPYVAFSALADAGPQDFYFENTVTAVGSWTTATDKSVTAASLSAGEWEIEGSITFLASASLATTHCVAQISATAANVGSPGDVGRVDSRIGPDASFAQTLVVRRRMVLTATTSINLNGRLVFSAGTPTVNATLRARKIR